MLKEFDEFVVLDVLLLVGLLKRILSRLEALSVLRFGLHLFGLRGENSISNSFAFTETPPNRPFLDRSPRYTGRLCSFSCLAPVPLLLRDRSGSFGRPKCSLRKSKVLC